LGTYFAWHVPVAYDTALEHPTWMLHFEHLCYFVTGCLLWWPVLHSAPRRLHDAAKAVYLFATFVLASPLGLLLALLPRPVYDFYGRAPERLWGFSRLADQELAGLTMASEQAVVFFAVFAFFFLRFLRDAAPAVLEEVAYLLDAGVPDAKDVVVRPLVEPAVRAVAEAAADVVRAGRLEPRHVHHRLCRLRQLDALETRPREVLHPGRVACL